jgi:hypothetical protein
MLKVYCFYNKNIVLMTHLFLQYYGPMSHQHTVGRTESEDIWEEN